MIEPWRRRDATPSTPSTRCDNLIYAQVLGLCDLVLSEVHHLHRVNRAWWRWMRYVLVTIIIFTMLGSVASMYAFSYTMYFKWPDYYVEAHGEPNTWSPYGFGNWFVYVAVLPCVEIKILRRVRAESSRRPRRHRRSICSMAWRCRFLTARRSQDCRVIAEK